MRIRKLRFATAIIIIIFVAGIIGLAAARMFIFKPPPKESHMRSPVVVAMMVQVHR